MNSKQHEIEMPKTRSTHEASLRGIRRRAVVAGVAVLALTASGCQEFTGQKSTPSQEFSHSNVIKKPAPSIQIEKDLSSIQYYKTSFGQKVPSRVDDFKYYNQTDLRWAYSKYNTAGRKGFNIGLNGCAPTAAAMVLTNLTGKHVDPTDTAAYYMRHGYVIPDKEGGGTDGEEAIQSIVRAYGHSAHEIQPTFSAIKETIDEKGYVVVNGQDSLGITPSTPGGHVYVIRGYTPDNQLEIADPASLENTLSAFPTDFILRPAGYVVAVTA